MGPFGNSIFRSSKCLTILEILKTYCKYFSIIKYYLIKRYFRFCFISQTYYFNFKFNYFKCFYLNIHFYFNYSKCFYQNHNFQRKMIKITLLFCFSFQIHHITKKPAKIYFLILSTNKNGKSKTSNLFLFLFY